MLVLLKCWFCEHAGLPWAWVPTGVTGVPGVSDGLLLWVLFWVLFWMLFWVFWV
ncbi:MAG: hypothetical protein H8E63_04985 [Proteobacteria bacterium]|nr:hypothetical protein [Pseudomonadota bacterium]